MAKAKAAKVKTMKQWFRKAEEEEESDQIEVFPHTQNPTYAWSKLGVKQTVRSIKTIPAETPIHDDAVRFVCVSDTHNKTDRLRVPPGDVLLHAGDFSMTGQMHEIEHFNTWLGSLPHKHKVVIAGNHEISFDDNLLDDYYCSRRYRIDAEKVKEYLKSKNVDNVRDLLTDCIYLEDSGVELYGINIYGSPWQPEFCGWAFNLERGQPCLDKWDLIPDNTDILITHGPPIGHGDLCKSQQRAGCVELLHTIQKRVKPKYHVFGHIHEDYGITTDGTTKYINASTCTVNYKATQRPIVFDIKLPPGMTKSSYINGTEIIRKTPMKSAEDTQQSSETLQSSSQGASCDAVDSVDACDTKDPQCDNCVTETTTSDKTDTPKESSTEQNDCDGLALTGDFNNEVLSEIQKLCKSD